MVGGSYGGGSCENTREVVAMSDRANTNQLQDGQAVPSPSAAVVAPLR